MKEMDREIKELIANYEAELEKHSTSLDIEPPSEEYEKLRYQYLVGLTAKLGKVIKDLKQIVQETQP